MPPEWEGEQVDLLLVTNSEATLWLDGEPVQGLVSGGAYVRADAMLAERAAAGQALSARVEIACNGLFGWSELHPQPQHVEAPAPPFRLERCELARFDREAWALSRDLDVLAALMDEQGVDDAWRGELLRELNRFCNAWDAGERATWPRGARDPRPAADAAQRDADARDHRHRPRAHRHGVAVAAGGDVSQVRADLRDPAAAHGALPGVPVRLLAGPAVRVDPRSRPGPVGADPRAGRGRAVAPGRRDVDRARLQPPGRASRSCASSSTASASSSASSVAARASSGTPTCSATTASCRRSCAAPGSTASSRRSSRGTASTRPSTTPSAGSGSTARRCSPTSRRPTPTTPRSTVPELRRAARDFKDHALSARSLLVFGWGDGGGGPTAQMLETLARVEDLQDVPRTAIGDPEAFFAELADEADWPEVVGELYLEYHRGTYTTQARTKRASRRAERALHDAELLAAVRRRAVAARGARRRVADAPAQPLPRHPARARRSARSTRARERDLAEVEAVAGAVRDRCVAGEVVNTVGVARARGRVDRRAGLRFAEAPPCGVGRLVEARAPCASSQDGDGSSSRTRRLRAVLGRDGTLRSLVELAGGREALAAPGNVLELYEDQPTDFEAWDLDPFHLETRSDCPPAASAEVVAGRPAARRGRRSSARSAGRAACARPSASTPSPRRLEFHCAIDWHEDHRALKVALPASPSTRRGRPTRCSSASSSARRTTPRAATSPSSRSPATASPTSPSTASASRCCPRRPTAGPSTATTMRMTLLRSPRWPDPEADVGHHELAFAILPARRRLAGRRRDRRGPALQRAAAARATARPGEPRSWFSTDAPGLLVDTVKRAEDGDELIVRLYEAHGGRGAARLRVGVPFATGVGSPTCWRTASARRRSTATRSSSLPAVRDRDGRARDRVAVRPTHPLVRQRIGAAA